ncbi:YfgM family protein [Vibrio porteresiae]|uniref:Ancillary SecYEG translocon subunit n=1 Tax=Vibrio porteresiae DSM 19223 TaxID=1123496 RepID=A0ABZ0QAR4_9VIBR|nr:YfgM family protein [Vibrio porteresiae]WPC73528.1 YfgM family protein [Vibrio porteresiae DSM 19223]
MELYDTEEQTVEAIKDWWKQNGTAVVIGAVIGLGGLFGWRYYHNSMVAEQESASANYTKIVQTLAAQGVKADQDIQNYIDANKDTQYAVLAATQLAKVQIEAGKLDDALTQLQWAQQHTDDAALSSVITFRVARVQAELGKYDEALKTLEGIKDQSLTGRVAELRGDVLMRKGDKAGAYTAYTEAQQAHDASQTLQMKLDDLAK